MIYGVLEYDIVKIKRNLPSDKCDVNFLNKASFTEHIIQHAIRQGHVAAVVALCGSGADINLSVQINQYLRGPLYFETLNEKVTPSITRVMLNSRPDLTLKDERGRSAIIYAMDKCNGNINSDIVSFMLNNGTPFTDRDRTGLTARDVARFGRRCDLVALIDKKYIELVRTSSLGPLKQIIMDAYDSIMINYNLENYGYATLPKDTQIARFGHSQTGLCGNDILTKLHTSIMMGEHYPVKRVLEESTIDWNMSMEPHEQTEMLLNTKDKGGRTAFMLAVLYERPSIAKLLLQDKYRTMIDVNRRDNCFRSVYHYACAIPEDTFRKLVENLGVDTNIQDVNQLTASDYLNNHKMHTWFKLEKKKTYGLSTELIAAEKYEDLRKIITSTNGGKKEFKSSVKNFNIPLSSFAKMLSPLMPDYKDLLFLAIDFGKDEIAARLADIGSDCARKETYNYSDWTSDEKAQEVSYDAPARAEHLGRHNLARYLHKRKAYQLAKAITDKVHEKVLKPCFDNLPVDKISLLPV